LNPLWIILAVIGTACLLLIANHDSGSVLGLRSDSFASLIWLAVWGTVLGTAIFSSRGRWRDMARYLAIWAAIALTLMAGYLYRYELQDFANRITAGVVPGSPISSTSHEGRVTTLVIRTRNGQFEAIGSANGANIRFVVDTGANLVVLTQEDARAAGIDTDRLDYFQRVYTANGTTTAAKITLDSLSIGDIERRNVEAMVARAGALDTSLLGMSFLTTLHAFEFRGDRLVLTD
jgi:aspartyl protease family protein